MGYFDCNNILNNSFLPLEDWIYNSLSFENKMLKFQNKNRTKLIDNIHIAQNFIQVLFLFLALKKKLIQISSSSVISFHKKPAGYVIGGVIINSQLYPFLLDHKHLSMTEYFFLFTIPFHSEVSGSFNNFHFSTVLMLFKIRYQLDS